MNGVSEAATHSPGIEAATNTESASAATISRSFGAVITTRTTDPALDAISGDFARDAEILGLISELRDVFENNFDRTWFSLIIDGMPIDIRTVREIRELVSLTAIYPGEEWQVFQAVQELETFHRTVKRFLLPVLKERLGISWLFPQRRVKDTRQYILRKLVAFTFPYNLERLRRLTQKLKSRLLFHYPFLQ